ncbi:NAD(P)-dependent oxidoreductase [Arenibacter sp. TNZ]|jgi:nucleoside-diphosphate-sugar epimerase|uniref:NAD-dependent epimerase/dehydratase family protein n=1 Tax=Arenibacter TaxID=178469 RepID=UPI000CD41703|nr:MULTISPECIES: NAD(P)-dependent oxidoreductase [Arenibacter]MCM4172787.1 NAD(P)-dependent oxidoreductase [Arenibacter sp. TNZ]
MIKTYPEFFKNEEELEEAISRPTPEVVKMMETLEGDIIFLGVSGKMGISMAHMAKRACDMAGIKKRIIGVSRFSQPTNKDYLESLGIEIISGDLVDQEFVKSLPKVENVIYLAGTKFGTDGNEPYTWIMNSFIPGLVVDHYKNSRIVALSTGCVYPLVNIDSGGSLESDPALPIGEYAQSCLGRERLFQYGSLEHKTPISLIRLNYAVEMRYGVLVDIALKIKNNQPVDVTMGYANIIWQGDANAFVLRSLMLCENPARILNLTGLERISIHDVAKKLGKLMGREVVITGKEDKVALLSNASNIIKSMGKPVVSVDEMIKWIADWVNSEQRVHGKPTHFEVKDGKY